MRPDRQLVAPINRVALSRNASCIRMACTCQVSTARAGLDGKLITPTGVDCSHHWSWGTWTVPPGRLTLGGEWFGPCRRTAMITSTTDQLLHWPFPHLDCRNFQSTSSPDTQHHPTNVATCFRWWSFMGPSDGDYHHPIHPFFFVVTVVIHASC